MFLIAGCYLLRAQGFLCSLEVHQVSLEINKLQFFIFDVKINFFSAVKFLEQDPDSDRDPQWPIMEVADPDPDPHLKPRRIHNIVFISYLHYRSEHQCRKIFSTDPLHFYAIISFLSLKSVRNFIRCVIFLPERFFGVIIKTGKKFRQNFYQCWGSVKFWSGSGSPDPEVPLANGSGSGSNSGSDYFIQWL